MLNRISEETIESIRKANDVVDVVGEYVQLKKQGRNYVGLCPFHNEKTPSFSVTQDKQIFHCFGCGKGGNVVTFLMEMENYSFYEALKVLSERSGIPLPDTGIRKESSLSQENQHILSAYEWLTKLYNHVLRYTKDGQDGYQYFNDRGINNESIDIFQLGFAPNVKDFTTEFLEKKGFHRQLLLKAGILSSNDAGETRDRFRGKVIFPIRNHLGKTIGFGGRTLSGGGPKYLNSSESDLFQKGRILYNFDLAKRHIRKEGEAVLFEGYMDVISAYQAGVKNVIATLGTALTESQAKLLNRYAGTVVLCYDADNAGIEATYKAAVLLGKAGCEVRIANLQDGLDPDDFIQKYGGEAFQKEVIRSSETFIMFYMRYLKRDYNLSLEGDRIEYIENILKQLAMIESPVEREYYLKDLSDEYGLSLDTLKSGISEHRQHTDVPQKRKAEGNKPRRNFYQERKLLPAFQNAERQLLAYMLQNVSVADKVRREIGAGFNLDEHKIISTHLYAYYEEGHPPDVSLFIEKLHDEGLKKLIIEIAMLPHAEDISDREIDDYLQLIHAESNDAVNIKELRNSQKLAEQQNDPIKAAKIAMQIIEIEKQMKNMN
jgi:DNA primase